MERKRSLNKIAILTNTSLPLHLPTHKSLPLYLPTTAAILVHLRNLRVSFSLLEFISVVSPCNVSMISMNENEFTTAEKKQSVGVLCSAIYRRYSTDPGITTWGEFLYQNLIQNTNNLLITKLSNLTDVIMLSITVKRRRYSLIG
jgi:hypothetical protein